MKSPHQLTGVVIAGATELVSRIYPDNDHLRDRNHKNTQNPPPQTLLCVLQDCRRPSWMLTRAHEMHPLTLCKPSTGHSSLSSVFPSSTQTLCQSLFRTHEKSVEPSHPQLSHGRWNPCFNSCFVKSENTIKPSMVLVNPSRTRHCRFQMDHNHLPPLRLTTSSPQSQVKMIMNRLGSK